MGMKLEMTLCFFFLLFFLPFSAGAGSSFEKIRLWDSVARLVSLVCVFILPFYFVWRSARKRYRKIRQTHGLFGQDGRNFLAAYASEAHFQKSKYLVYEGIGRLRIDRGSVSFLGETVEQGSPLDLQFSPTSARASWVGRTFRSGIAAWFVIEQEGKKHYFTSDAILRGPFALGSFKRSAMRIFEEVQKILPPCNAV